MPVTSIAVAPLSDHRLQLFASLDGQLWSTWKLSGTDANSNWTDWSKFQPDNDEDFVSFELGRAAQLPDEALQLFVRAGVPNEINVLGGPVVATTWKLSDDADATWAPWDPFYAGSFGPPGSPATGIVALDVSGLSDLRLQVLFTESAVGGSGPATSRLMTSWKETSQVDAEWVPVQPFSPQPPETLAPIVMGTLAFGGLQLWGTGLSGIWTTWKEGGANSGWLEWGKFQPLPHDRGAGALVAAQLPDGRAQLWAAGITTGDVYTCWKQTAAPGAPWTNWQQFLGQDITGLCVAPLSDGRLQLWGLDRNGTLFTTWKKTADADADWASWTTFPLP